MLQLYSSFSIASAWNSQQSLVLWIYVFFLLIPCCFSVHASSPITEESQEYLNAIVDKRADFNVKRSDFPSDFIFGVSTSAAQTEGSINSGGRGPSILDKFIWDFPDSKIDRSKYEVAIDSYNRYKEDALALKNLGIDAYRFSIPWTRILPDGTLSGGINKEGIDHYNSLINELVKHGITPFVTLLHFDFPQALQEKYGGFLNRTVVEDFKKYAELCFETFGDRVKNWITINEPVITANFGYNLGVSPPGRCSDRKRCRFGNSATEPYIVAHNLILAHATAARLYKHKYQSKQGGEIGWSHVTQFYEPYSNTVSDRVAAKRSWDFEFGWFIEPLVVGRYPASMRRMVKDRLPVFSAKEKQLVKGSFDFIGINYYTSRYAKNIPFDPFAAPLSYMADQHVNFTVVDKNGVPIGPKARGTDFLYIYPQGLYKLMKLIQEKYPQNITIYITENGVTEKRNTPVHEALNDQQRIEFIQKHLQQIRRASREGVKVKGYLYWSAFDDFEWSDGYGARFGLYYIDYDNNLQRIPKKSAIWYHHFVQAQPTNQAQEW